MKALRPHQERGIEMLRQSLGMGKKRPILHAPTGYGKTVIAAHMIRSGLEKGRRSVFVVDAISLIDQTVARFYEDGITDIGVIQADHPMTDWSKPVQVASVQTLAARCKSGGWPEADFVLVDECHCRYEAVERWMSDCPQTPFIGLSATPWAKGLGLVYDDLVIAATTQQLIDEGYLCPFRTFAAAHPDLTGVGTRQGEYVTSDLAEVMADGALVADIVTTWQRYGDNRPTIAFCVDRAHAKKVQRQFQEAGIGCGYIDANTPRAERAEIEQQLNRGDIRIVASVDCLTKGIDWSIGCLIVARPTKSLMKWVQMIGRGLRVNPEAGPDCVILDHSDNTARMGFVTDIHFDRLDTSKKGKGEAQRRDDPLPKECAKCGWLKPPLVVECPSCGFVPERQSEIDPVDGELVQVGGEAVAPKKAEASRAEKQLWYSSLLAIAQERGYKRGWAANQYREKFGAWPRLLAEIPTDPPAHVRSWIKSRQIAYAKRRAA